MSAEPPPSATTDAGGRGRSVTVLVVDGGVALRESRGVLEKAGYKVLSTSNVGEALALSLARSADIVLTNDGRPGMLLALAESPDMIVLDEAMLGVSSVWAVRQIKKQRPAMPIVVTNVNPTTGDRERFLAAGAEDVLSKPLRLSDLLAALVRLRP